MAPLPVISDVFRVTFKWSDPAFSRNAVNVMHFRKSSATASAVFSAIDAHLLGNMWLFQCSTSKIAELDITPLDGISVTVPVVPTPGTKYAGQGSASDMLPNTAALVKFATTVRGRSNQGRVYLPWVREPAANNGKLTDATNIGLCQTAWSSFITAMDSAGCNLVVASYKLATAVDVTAAVVETPLATQRRRQLR